MTKAKKELGPCQVRSGTDRPCLRPAVVEIWGVPFCEPCAHEQEAYFAIGELTAQESQSLDKALLVETLERIQWRRRGRIAAEKMERPKSDSREPEVADTLPAGCWTGKKAG